MISTNAACHALFPYGVSFRVGERLPGQDAAIATFPEQRIETVEHA
jgi:hypothetical protein